MYKGRRNLAKFTKLLQYLLRFIGRFVTVEQKTCNLGEENSSSLEDRIIKKAINDLGFESLLRTLANVDWVLCPTGVLINVEAEYRRIHTKRWQRLKRYAETLCMAIAERIALPGENTLEIAQWLSYNVQSLVRKLDRLPHSKHSFITQTRGECEAVWSALRYLIRGQIPPKFVREDAFFALSKWWFVIVQPVAIGMGWWGYRPPISTWDILLMAFLGSILTLQGIWIKWLLKDPCRFSRIDRLWVWRGEKPESLLQLHASADVISGLGIGFISYLIGRFAAAIQSWYSLFLASLTTLLILANIFSKLGLRRTFKI